MRWIQLVRLTRLPGLVHEVWDLKSAHINIGRGLVNIYVIFKIKTVDTNVTNKKKVMPDRFRFLRHWATDGTIKVTLSPCLVGKRRDKRRVGKRKWEQKRVYFNSIVWFHFFKPNIAQVLIISLPFLQPSNGVVQKPGSKLCNLKLWTERRELKAIRHFMNWEPLEISKHSGGFLELSLLVHSGIGRTLLLFGTRLQLACTWKDMVSIWANDSYSLWWRIEEGRCWSGQQNPIKGVSKLMRMVVQMAIEVPVSQGHQTQQGTEPQWGRTEEWPHSWNSLFLIIKLQKVDAVRKYRKIKENHFLSTNQRVRSLLTISNSVHY